MKGKDSHRGAKAVRRRSAGTVDGWVCLGLFGLSAIVRLLFLRGIVDRDLPFSILYYGDSRVYREFALALLRGEAYDQGIPFHPPLLAYVLSGIIRLVGENPGAMRGLLAVISASTAPLTYLLGRRLSSRSVALVGSLLATFSFGLCVTAISPNTEALYIPILVAQALTVISMGDALAENARGRARALSIATGLVLGVGSLTRAEHLGLAALLPVALAVRRPTIGFRRVLGATLLLLGVAAALVAPWTLHNYRALSRFNQANPHLAEPMPTFVPVSSYGALNFALANSSTSNGTFRPDSIVQNTGGGRLDLTDPRQLSLYLHGYREGWNYLKSHPAATTRLILRKVTIAAEAGALGFGLSNWPGGLAGIRRPVDMFSPDVSALLPVSIVLLLAGTWLSRAGWRPGGIVWLLGLHKLVICMAFFGYVRLFIHLAPFAYLLQSAALVALVARIRSPGVQRAVATVGIALVLCLLLELGGRAVKPLDFTASGSSDPRTGKILQDTEVTLHPTRTGF